MKIAAILPFFLMTAMCCLAQKVSVEGIRYEIDPLTMTASVTDSLDQGSDGEPTGLYQGVIKIPKSFKYNGEKYKVTSIGENAFWNCYVSEVEIPNTVVSIEKHAFFQCSGLTSLTLPKSLTTIADNAFESCTGLISITFPKSVTSIGEDAFYNCDSLSSITISKSVTSIGSCAFLETSITSIVVDEDNPNYCAVNNILFNKDKTEILFCPYNITGAFSIPNSVTCIAENAFSACSELTSLTIPNSVTSIGECAFSGCSGLTSLTIPNSVTSIDVYAFSGCSGLTSLTISNSLTRIEREVFSGCTSLTAVTIPQSVTSIGENAFISCSELSSLTIPNSVTNIGRGAFSGCSSLTSVIIPQSVTSIGECAFSGCEGITSISVPASVTDIGEAAFTSCSKLGKVVVDADIIVERDYEKDNNLSAIFGKQVREYVVGNDAKKIGKHAFHGCENLESITMGNAVTTIDDGAFADCKSLASITIPASVTRIGDYAFAGCMSLYSVEVPASVTRIGKLAFPYHIQKNAQPEICRKFFGLTLGVTTKQQAISRLLGQQANIAMNTKKALYLSNVSHDGNSFGSANLHFYNGIFSQVDFNEAELGETKQMSQSKYQQIKDFYDKKHGSYKYYFMENQGDVFDDDVTKLIINQNYIIFSDNNMGEQDSKAQAQRMREIHPLPEAGPGIDKTVLGCTLGVSTKQQVKDALKALNIKVIDDCSPDSIIFGSVTHEGVEFSKLNAVFFAGRLLSMRFTKSGKALSRSEYNTLKASLGARYSAYDTNYYPDEDSSDELASYSDDIVNIGICLKGHPGIMDGGLIYLEKELSQKYSEGELKSLRGQKTISPDKKHIVDLYNSVDASVKLTKAKNE